MAAAVRQGEHAQRDDEAAGSPALQRLPPRTPSATEVTRDPRDGPLPAAKQLPPGRAATADRLPGRPSGHFGMRLHGTHVLKASASGRSPLCAPTSLRRKVGTDMPRACSHDLRSPAYEMVRFLRRRSSPSRLAQAGLVGQGGCPSSTTVTPWLPSRIPKRYHRGMSTQIAVRLPDELVAYVDQAVASGRVRSRAELVSRLIARDARRQRAEEDLQRLIDAGVLEDDEALAMARATSSTPIED